MRRWLIRTILPLVFCSLPPIAAALIVAAMPAEARDFYAHRLTPLDMLMIGLGSTLFVIQMLLSWRGLQWRERGFDESVDPWLSHLAQAAEWFPLLGLIGTVAGIMQTFASFGASGEAVTQQMVIAKYAPAITATCSGLFMALLNILPTWVLMIGRDVILSLAGAPPAEQELAVPYSNSTAPPVPAPREPAKR